MGSRGVVPRVEPEDPEATLRDRGAQGRRRRILVADDDPDTRALYAWGLRAAGWFVTEAADGFEAVAMAAALRPHAIVMDLCMPGLGGADAVVCLKRDARTKAIPVVACSGLDPVRAEPCAHEAGCDAFVAKPCSPDDLCDLLEKVTSHRPHQSAPTLELALVHADGPRRR
ncbi:MAG: response regulator [Polyangiaceae bacterium]